MSKMIKVFGNGLQQGRYTKEEAFAGLPGEKRAEEGGVITWRGLPLETWYWTPVHGGRWVCGEWEED